MNFNFWPDSDDSVAPDTHPAYFKIAGATEDRIQFFSSAYFAESEFEIARLISADAYKGDLLFLSGQASRDMPSSAHKVPQEIPFEANQRLETVYEVTRFDANNIEIRSDAPIDTGFWLMYSDVWHPDWHATVGSSPAKIYRANLAYKAVYVPKGERSVRFTFAPRYRSAVLKFLGLNSALWFGGLFWMALLIFRGKIDRHGSASHRR